MFIERDLKNKVHTLAKKFPVVGIFGPRQSGKTTLAQISFSKYKYINLEELDIRRYAAEDPRGFLQSLLEEEGIILDEIQNVPDLLSYIQANVDRMKKPGFFVLTGSQNILLNHHINQTLAGRIAILTLLPLALEELKRESLLSTKLEVMLFQGFYPPIYASRYAPTDWYANYIRTYVERDVRQIKNITDLTLFQKFIKLCAGRIGQLLNLTSLGNDCGINAHTVRSWLSLLEASYIIFLLYPHHKNFNKRLVKMPKLYFYDTGIACHLLEISSPKDLEMHYLKGGLFESMILADLLKQRHNTGLQPNIYFWRDKSGNEIDCILEKGEKLTPIEIKSGATINSDYFDSLVKWNAIAHSSASKGIVVYGGTEKQIREQGNAIGWKDSEKINL